MVRPSWRSPVCRHPWLSRPSGPRPGLSVSVEDFMLLTSGPPHPHRSLSSNIDCVQHHAASTPCHGSRSWPLNVGTRASCVSLGPGFSPPSSVLCCTQRLCSSSSGPLRVPRTTSIPPSHTPDLFSFARSPPGRCPCLCARPALLWGAQLCALPCASVRGRSCLVAGFPLLDPHLRTRSHPH